MPEHEDNEKIPKFLQGPFCGVCGKMISSETNIPGQGRCSRHSDRGKLNIGFYPIVDESHESDVTLREVLKDAFEMTSKAESANPTTCVRVMINDRTGRQIASDWSLLALATWIGDVPHVKLLLTGTNACGAFARVTRPEKLTPLGLLATRITTTPSHEEISRILVTTDITDTGRSKRKLPLQANQDIYDTFIVAVRNRNLPIVKLLQQYWNFSLWKSSEGIFGIHIAAEKNWVEGVKHFMSTDSTWFKLTTKHEGDTALMVAIKANSTESARALLMGEITHRAYSVDKYQNKASKSALRLVFELSYQSADDMKARNAMTEMFVGYYIKTKRIFDINYLSNLVGPLLKEDVLGENFLCVMQYVLETASNNEGLIKQLNEARPWYVLIRRFTGYTPQRHQSRAYCRLTYVLFLMMSLSVPARKHVVTRSPGFLQTVSEMLPSITQLRWDADSKIYLAVAALLLVAAFLYHREFGNTWFFSYLCRFIEPLNIFLEYKRRCLRTLLSRRIDEVDKQVGMLLQEVMTRMRIFRGPFAATVARVRNGEMFAEVVEEFGPRPRVLVHGSTLFSAQDGQAQPLDDSQTDDEVTGEVYGPAPRMPTHEDKANDKDIPEGNRSGVEKCTVAEIKAIHSPDGVSTNDKEEVVPTADVGTTVTVGETKATPLPVDRPKAGAASEDDIGTTLTEDEIKAIPLPVDSRKAGAVSTGIGGMAELKSIPQPDGIPKTVAVPEDGTTLTMAEIKAVPLPDDIPKTGAEGLPETNVGKTPTKVEIKAIPLPNNIPPKIAEAVTEDKVGTMDEIAAMPLPGDIPKAGAVPEDSVGIFTMPEIEATGISLPGDVAQNDSTKTLPQADVPLRHRPSMEEVAALPLPDDFATEPESSEEEQQVVANPDKDESGLRGEADDIVGRIEAIPIEEIAGELKAAETEAEAVLLLEKHWKKVEKCPAEISLQLTNKDERGGKPTMLNTPKNLWNRLKTYWSSTNGQKSRNKRWEKAAKQLDIAREKLEELGLHVLQKSVAGGVAEKVEAPQYMASSLTGDEMAAISIAHEMAEKLTDTTDMAEFATSKPPAELPVEEGKQPAPSATTNEAAGTNSGSKESPCLSHNPLVQAAGPNILDLLLTSSAARQLDPEEVVQQQPAKDEATTSDIEEAILVPKPENLPATSKYSEKVVAQERQHPSSSQFNETACAGSTGVKEGAPQLDLGESILLKREDEEIPTRDLVISTPTPPTAGMKALPEEAGQRSLTADATRNGTPQLDHGIKLPNTENEVIPKIDLTKPAPGMMDPSGELSQLPNVMATNVEETVTVPGIGTGGHSDGVGENSDGVGGNSDGIGGNSDGIGGNSDGVGGNSDGVGGNSDGVSIGRPEGDEGGIPEGNLTISGAAGEMNLLEEVSKRAPNAETISNIGERVPAESLAESEEVRERNEETTITLTSDEVNGPGYVSMKAHSDGNLEKTQRVDLSKANSSCTFPEEDMEERTKVKHASRKHWTGSVRQVGRSDKGGMGDAHYWKMPPGDEDKGARKTCFAGLDMETWPPHGFVAEDPLTYLARMQARVAKNDGRCLQRKVLEAIEDEKREREECVRLARGTNFRSLENKFQRQTLCPEDETLSACPADCVCSEYRYLLAILSAKYGEQCRHSLGGGSVEGKNLHAVSSWVEEGLARCPQKYDHKVDNDRHSEKSTQTILNGENIVSGFCRDEAENYCESNESAITSEVPEWFAGTDLATRCQQGTKLDGDFCAGVFTLLNCDGTNREVVKQMEEPVFQGSNDKVVAANANVQPQREFSATIKMAFEQEQLEDEEQQLTAEINQSGNSTLPVLKTDQSERPQLIAETNQQLPHQTEEQSDVSIHPGLGHRPLSPTEAFQICNRNWLLHGDRWCSKLDVFRRLPVECLTMLGDKGPAICPNIDFFIIGVGKQGGITVLGSSRDGSPLAVTVVHPARYSSEAEKWTMCHLPGISHKNLVKFMGIYLTHQAVFISAELCQGTLDQYINLTNTNGGLQPWQTAQMSVDVLNGLAYLHEKKILHKNLRPTNTFITAEGTVKLGKFGYDPQQIPRAIHRGILDPCCWLPPEIFMLPSETSYNELSDVQVCGMLLHYIQTKGEHPFGKVPFDIITNIMLGHPKLVTMDSKMTKVISQMIQKTQLKRPTVREVLHMLESGNEQWN